MALIAQITNSGVEVPSYTEVLAELKGKFTSIYGDDVNLDNDSADGQWVAIIAAAINDANAAITSVWNSFSPATAAGEGLSSVVKINGIKRNSASYSSVDLRIVGQAGTTISNGMVTDEQNNQWQLPTSVTVPTSGEITVTAWAATQGAISAESGSISKIATPTLGWQSVLNPAPASVGQPIESDAALRIRQTQSVASPSLSVLDGIKAAIEALAGVTRLGGLENDTDQIDSNGIPAHTIALVVEGGDANAVASAILLKKSPGSGTYGSTTLSVNDGYGVPKFVRFSRPADVPVSVKVSIRALDGYAVSIGEQIQQAIVDYINSLRIGDDVTLTDLYLPARLGGGAGAAYYKLVDVQMAQGDGALGTADIIVPFNAAASCQLANVHLVVTV